MNFWSQHLLDIQLPFLHMDKLEVERPIRWLELRKSSAKKYSNRIKLMASFQEPSKIYGTCMPI
jgi:hypothetical protein